MILVLLVLYHNLLSADQYDDPGIWNDSPKVTHTHTYTRTRACTHARTFCYLCQRSLNIGILNNNQNMLHPTQSHPATFLLPNRHPTGVGSLCEDSVLGIARYWLGFQMEISVQTMWNIKPCLSENWLKNLKGKGSLRQTLSSKGAGCSRRMCTTGRSQRVLGTAWAWGEGGDVALSFRCMKMCLPAQNEEATDAVS